MLSAIGKIWNANKYHFPIDLCIESLLDGCSDFILTVCTDSEDDTVEYCKELEKSFNGKLKLVYSKWIIDQAEGKYNMRRLADLAILKADNDWVLSVDMDEVYRPGEIAGLVKQLKILPEQFGGATVNFIHHYIDIHHRIFGKLYDRSARVGRKSMGWHSYNDGFGLEGNGQVYISATTCNHYGFARSAVDTIKKELNFQETLYKPVDTQFPDPRLVEYMKRIKDGENIDKNEFYKYMQGEKDFIVKYNGKHWPGILEWFNKINDIKE